MVLLITRRIWVKLSTVFILLLRRSENILTSRLLSRLLDLLSSIDSDWPRTDKKKSGGNWVAKCDVFIVSRIIFSLVFARGRNDYISFSINIGTNKLEHDPQDTSPFLSNFQLTCTIAEKDMSTFRYSSASHIASSKKAFVKLLKMYQEVILKSIWVSFRNWITYIHLRFFSRSSRSPW